MEKSKKGGKDIKVYALVASVVLFTAGYAFWPSMSNSQETSALLTALLKQNQELQGTIAANAAAQPLTAPAPAAVRVPACSRAPLSPR